MSKSTKRMVAVLSAIALFVAAFVTILFLSVPLGGRASVLPVTVLYVVGGVVAALFLAAAAFFFLRSKKDR